MSDEPLDHIERAALPWRDEHLTECGRPTSDVARVLSRAEAIAKWKRLGSTRAYMTTCVTCAQTANNHSTWDDDPVAVMLRYAERCRHTEPGSQLTLELRAVAALIEAHRAEFDDYLVSLEAVTSLAAARRKRRA